MTQVQEKTQTNLSKVATAMLDLLDARSKDVVTRRFGLKKPDPETLESIGREYGITRERVRQIEANAKRALTNLEDLYKPAYQVLSDVFTAHGGIMAQDHVVEAIRVQVGSDTPANLVAFYLVILPDFTIGAPTKMFRSHWRHDKALHPLAETVVKAAHEILHEKNHPLATNDFFDHIRRHIGTTAAQLPDAVVRAALVASLQIDPTVFDEWGLITWPEIHPRGVGDKAYAVLRRHGKPSHFREITTLINEAQFDHKKANPQTVHNELIKDSRFVLVGRGLYGLKEWGYMSGTVSDVLAAILEDAAKPLSSEELIGKVLKQRIVKKNTILLSLQNSKRFHKTTSGYTLKS